MKNEFELSYMSKWQKAMYYRKEYGVGFLMRKAARKLGIPVKEAPAYLLWNRAHQPDKQELKAQREASFPEMPRIAVVVDGMEGSPSELRLTLDSIRRQTYEWHWVLTVKEPMGVEALLEKGEAEFFLFVQSGIELRPQALYRLIQCRNQRKDGAIGAIYFDEDCRIGKKYRNPYFKPDRDSELILNFQYLGQAFAVERKVLAENPETELWGNQWYDLALRVMECDREVVHIPEVLFAKTRNVTADTFYRSSLTNQASYVAESLKRQGKEARVLPGAAAGFFHVSYIRKEQPLISVIIPNKDHMGELQVCIESLQHKSSYRNFEVVIAENNSVQEETFHYYQQVRQQYENVKVVEWKEEFNYSAINNFAAKSARGELFLFLNNDTELINEDCLEELVQCCDRPGIGAAGAMLYYEDGTIQHGGVIIGIGGFAANALWSLTDRDEHYYPYSVTMREISACTGACLMVKRETFDQAGGFDQQLAVALNDVDLCLRIRSLGQKIIFNPYAKLYHYESKSRGYEDSQEKIDRFNREIAYFQEKWKEQLEAGDPYYNRNQTLHRADYSVEW